MATASQPPTVRPARRLRLERAFAYGRVPEAAPLADMPLLMLPEEPDIEPVLVPEALPDDMLPELLPLASVPVPDPVVPLVLEPDPDMPPVLEPDPVVPLVPEPDVPVPVEPVLLVPEPVLGEGVVLEVPEPALSVPCLLQAERAIAAVSAQTSWARWKRFIKSPE